MAHTESLAFVLVGGVGERLIPLTNFRAKPAIPIAGTQRVIDYVISNIWNSKIRNVILPTQHLPASLNRQIKLGHSARFGISTEQYIDDSPPVPIRGRELGRYTGTASAVAQQASLIRHEEPDIVLVFGGDHVYMMDYRDFEAFHLDHDADLTIMAVRWPVGDASRYGVLEVDTDGRVVGFEEKPRNPKPLPDDPAHCLVSMGNYAWKHGPLLEALAADAEKEPVQDDRDRQEPERYTRQDFGRNVIPSTLRDKRRRVFACDFSRYLVRGAAEKERGYWRDIGTIESYYATNMELRATEPAINLYNPHWPIYTYIESGVPAKLIHGSTRVVDSLVANGVIVSAATVERSILSTVGKVDDGAVILDSLLLGHDVVGAGARLRRAIVDKWVTVPAGESVGLDHEKDLARGFTLVDGGRDVTLEMLRGGYRCTDACITVVPRSYEFAA
jgi:glucose-1-phosphate adenylyltransferase